MSTPPKNTINGLPGDAEVQLRARAIFRNACEDTDSYHALRLGMARRKAVHLGASGPTSRIWAPLAGGAVACCALVVGAMWMRSVPPAGPGATIGSSTPVASIQSDNPEELTPEIGSAQMEMVQDLDFYRWLATQPTVASAPRGGGR
jgi:hypothetical protein